jgi:hypothetical protein
LSVVINNGVPIFELSTGVDPEETVVEYFVEISRVVPSLDVALALMEILSTFWQLPEQFNIKIGKRIYSTLSKSLTISAQTALFFLSKVWETSETDLSFDQMPHSEKYIVSILSIYLMFRNEQQRLQAIYWLLVNHLLTVVPAKDRERAKMDRLLADDNADVLGDFADMQFVSFQR